MDRTFGGVCYAGIDTDPCLKYPKGSSRITFNNRQSYVAAQFARLRILDMDRRGRTGSGRSTSVSSTTPTSGWKRS
jgi:hypothetical protein